jgi:hypothetical protein
MGWFAPSNVVTTETNGSYSIQPFEINTGGLQALKVRRGTGNDAWLWLEYRQLLGDYDSTLNPQVFTGALVHYQDSTTGTHTHLLDFTKGSSGGFNDAALTGSFTDPYTNVSINVTSATASALNVDVFYGPVPCVRALPTVTLSPPNPSVYSGSPVAYTVTVTNRDNSGCAATTFTLDSSLPSGWENVFSQGTLTLNPGQAGSVTMTKNVPAGITPTSYAVNAGTLSDANHAAASGSANATVVTPPDPIFSTLTVSSPSVKAKETVSITATITKAGGVKVSGATVTFVMNRPGGSATKTVTTNAQGVAVWSYKTTQKGTYSVTASASSNGASTSAGPVTFTAN